MVKKAMLKNMLLCTVHEDMIKVKLLCLNQARGANSLWLHVHSFQLYEQILQFHLSASERVD